MSDDLKKFSLVHDDKRNDWALKNDETGRTKARFELKADATAGGALAGALGKQGGSVKIQKMDGKYQEERTYPRDRDPKKSPG